MDSPPEDGACAVTITAPDREWLQTFVRQLVNDRLVAAAHVDVMRTTYRWKGKVCEADEARATMHTSFARIDLIVEEVHKSHPFEVACVAALPIMAGERRYLDWVLEESS